MASETKKLTLYFPSSFYTPLILESFLDERSEKAIEFYNTDLYPFVYNVQFVSWVVKDDVILIETNSMP